MEFRKIGIRAVQMVTEYKMNFEILDILYHYEKLNNQRTRIFNISEKHILSLLSFTVLPKLPNAISAMSV